MNDISTLLRPARAEDAADVARVLRASRLHFLPYAPPVHTEAEHVAWVRDALLPSGGVTLAIVDGGVVGVIAVRRGDDGHWIDQLYIEPAYCRRGVGSLLMKAALPRLRRPIRLYTFQQNHGARRFYERFGFVPIEWSDGSNNEERCPDILYELRD